MSVMQILIFTNLCKIYFFHSPHNVAIYTTHYLQQYDSIFTKLITKSTILATLLYIYIGTNLPQ